MDDEFGLGRKKAVFITALVCFLGCNGVIFGLAHGVLDDLDFWSNVFCMVVFATVEAIIFGWVVGIEEAWIETHRGADVRLPLFFKFVLKYITPGFLLTMLGVWFYQKSIPMLMMEGVAQEDKPWIMAERIFLLAFLTVLIILIKKAWKGRPIPVLAEKEES
jgi:MFS family permease